MGKEPYVSPEGFTPVVLEVFPYRQTGLACLVVQSNEDRDLHLSEINLCEDFSAEDPETVFSIKSWIYSMLQITDDEIYIAHSGKALRRGAHAEPQTVLTVDADMTKLCAGSGGIYVLGLHGYVAFYDGRTLTDISVAQSDDIYFVAETPNGTIYACGGKGGLFRRDGAAWSPIDLGTNAEIYRILLPDDKTLLLAGSNGFCARLAGDALTVFKTPEGRDYRAVALFGKQLFFGAGMHGLDVLKDGEVVPFKDNIYSYNLFANDQYLFASGLNEVARFDGDDWLATEFT